MNSPLILSHPEIIRLKNRVEELEKIVREIASKIDSKPDGGVPGEVPGVDAMKIKILIDDPETRDVWETVKKAKTVETTFDFGSGPVPAHRHKNPDGSIGGWVANTAWADVTAFIGPDALVYENARVLEYALVYESAQIYGDVRVWGDAQIYRNARVCGNDLIWYGERYE